MPDHIYSAIDTTRTYSFRQSPWQMMGLVLAGLVMTGAAAMLAFGVIDVGSRMGGLAPVVGYVGLVFFGGGTIMIVWRIMALRGPVLTLSPEGLRDVRVAAEIIPWPAIEAYGTWSANKQSFVILRVAPEVERGLRPTRIARWTRSANRSLGADGLAIGTTGLELAHDDLLRLIAAYLAPYMPAREEHDGECAN